MTGRIFYTVRESRVPVDELLTATPLQRFVDLEHATREQLGGAGLTFADVRTYLERTLTAEDSFSLVSTERDILLYRAVAWLVLIAADPAVPFSSTATIGLRELRATVVSGDDEGPDPKDDGEAPAPTKT